MHKILNMALVIFISLLNSVNSNCVADEINSSITPIYQWGRGINIPSANLNIGGYFNMTFEHFESEQDIAALDELSLFISWSPLSQLHFFAEFEMESSISTHGIADFSESFSIERLYVDFLATDSLSFRFGQFLTPVGTWNSIHAAPLVWTTSRPIVTESQFFPSRSNGLMISKQFMINNHDPDFSLYFDDSADLDPRSIDSKDNSGHLEDEVAFEYAIGTHIIYEPINFLQTGVSYLTFKKDAKKQLSTNHLFGLDLFWQNSGYEMQMEFAYRTASDEQGSETSTYLQGIVPIGYNVFAVSRYEFINGTHQLNSDLETFDGTSHIFIPALAWRPYVPLVVKAEYRLGSNNKDIAPSGFFASVSMFF